MKLTIPRAELVSALALVKPAAGKTLPILTHVALTANEKSVELCCTDLDLTVRTRVPAEIKKSGETTVRVGLLHELARSLPDEHIALEVKKSGLEVAGVAARKAGGGSDYELPTLDKEEFPPVARVKDGVEFKLQENDLHAALAQTAFAMSTDAARLVLCGAFLQMNSCATLAATDGRRLAVGTGACEGHDKAEVILPARAVEELLRLLDPASERKVTCVLGKQSAQFNLGDTTLNTKLIEAIYPNYRQIIPGEEGAPTVPIGRADLLSAIKRVQLVSTDSCELEFKGQMLTIRDADKSIGRACETLLIPKTDTLKLRFNPHYLCDALSARTDDELIFVGRNEQTPAMFKSKLGDWFCIICPQREASSSKPEPKPAKEPAAAK